MKSKTIRLQRFILRYAFLLLAPLFLAGIPAHAFRIDERGIWVGLDATTYHAFDGNLATALAGFFSQENALSIVDFGCGMGYYSRVFSQHQIYVEAYDGNPKTPALTLGLGKVQDLSVPFDLEKRFDWVLCLEVGEHIPKAFEAVLIENLVSHCEKGIVISWAVPGQGGDGHVNEQPNDYIRDIFHNLGFVSDHDVEQALRARAYLKWFKNTVMVFRKAP